MGLKYSKSHTVGNHICGLKRADTQDFEVLTMSTFRRLRRNIKMSKYISTEHPQAHVYYRTNTAIMIEREKHIHSLEYAHIIHPFSTFRMNWETFMVVILILYLMMIPWLVAFLGKETVANLRYGSFVEMLLDYICISDVILRFFTGYAVGQTKEVVLYPRAIMINYVLSLNFVMDMVSSVPIETIVYVLLSFGVHDFYLTYIHLNAFWKILRFRILLEYAKSTGEHWRVKESVMSFIKYGFMVFFIIHWIGCLQYIVPYYWHGGFGQTPDTSWTKKRGLHYMSLFEKYVECIFKASIQLFCVSNNIYELENTPDILMDIIFGLLGYIFTGFALVIFLQIMFRISTSGIKYHSVMNQLTQYMRHKQLPLAMQTRLIDYYDYRYRKSYFREETIFPTLSGRLRKGINAYVCLKLVQKVPVLKELPSVVISNIIPCLREEVFLPNDIIVKAGTTGDCMYFIHTGTVAVYTPTGKEVCHLQDGAYFGEMGLIAKDQKRIANVVALEISELYRLDRKHFESLLKTLPDFYKKLERVADRRRENTLVMEEIHRKHILEKTMKMMDDKGL